MTDTKIATDAEREHLLDEALEESFPASDPISPGVGPGEPLSSKTVPGQKPPLERQ